MPTWQCVQQSGVLGAVAVTAIVSILTAINVWVGQSRRRAEDKKFNEEGK